MFNFGKKSGRTEVELTASNRTVLRILALVILSFVFLAAVRQAVHALLLIFTAFFLTLALNEPVRWAASRLPGKRKGSRSMATGIAFVLIIIIFGGFLASIVPPLVQQTTNFIEVAPGLVEDVRDENSSLGNFVRRYKLEDEVDRLSGELSDRLGNVSGTAVSTASRVGSSIFSTLTVLALTFMMLAEGPRWVAFGKRLVPAERRDHVDGLVRDMYKVIKGYVNGQVVLAALAASLILVPLIILDISYPVALMVIVFICGLIPMVGHIIGAIIVSAVALVTSPWAALSILAYYFLYQQIENYIVQPRIQANTTNMSPLLVFSSVIIGVNLNGLFGGLVAIPVAGCLRILILDYLNNRNLLEAPAKQKP